ncbi:agamous-like MADS-box protein AGL29 [Solanum lycopersicum]|uniref:agamous-like MADS-box protein AGL29 n=1 Tax=Solanum lycopersicum TaxID=4081 RepID=UPI000276C587|nr:agamous-like MADS-box protein AGL29 [Solanum lycopersicum]
MEHKKTAGRQKISLAKIENESARLTTFSKRRSGLYKKACELVRECDVALGIVMSSPKGIPYSFSSPTSNVVIDRFINPTANLSSSDRLVAAEARKKVSQFYDILNELDEREKIANEKLDRMNEARDLGWWESIDQLNVRDVKKLEAWLISGEFKLNEHLEQLENGASSSSQIPSDDANISPNVF